MMSLPFLCLHQNSSHLADKPTMKMFRTSLPPDNKISDLINPFFYISSFVIPVTPTASDQKDKVELFVINRGIFFFLLWIIMLYWAKLRMKNFT